VALVAIALLWLAACDVRTEVLVDVNERGAGTVTVSVGLDADAVDRLPSLDDLVMTDDLHDAGWTVTGPDRDDSGTTWFRAEKRFATPEAANAILAEISGPDGPFHDLTLSRELSMARTRLEFDGAVDLTGGLTVFSDAALAQSLEGIPLGEPVEQIEQRVGEPLADVFSFRLVLRMPGDVESNARPTGGDGGDGGGEGGGGGGDGVAVWTPSLADTTPTDVAASTEVWRSTTLVAIAIGAGALVLLAAWLVLRLAPPERMLGRRSRDTRSSPG
jgi:hypothetical protein